MTQYSVWEGEYKAPRLITNSDEPSNDFKRFIKVLRKEYSVDLDGLRVLDLGSGTGKNAIFLAERSAVVMGYEISDTALDLATKRAVTANVADKVTFQKQDIGSLYPINDQTIDLVLDVISSNSLHEEARKSYLSEVYRVLKSGGFFFVRALCKDGDKNAQKLLKNNPGPEPDTYVIPEFGLTERVFSEQDFRTLYGAQFSILSLDRKSSYALFKGIPYKRNYWLAYMQKSV